MSSPFTNASARTINLGIMVFRVALGIVFLYHGWQKVFVMGHPAVADGFTKMGVPAPEVTSFLVSWLELLAGGALIIGLLTRLAALGLAIDMLGAIVFVHGKNGFGLQTMGAEFVFILCAGAVLLVLGGPGAASLDGMIFGGVRSGN